MTLLIDPPNAPGHGRLWSHLASDSSYDELHRFAGTLGIPRRGFDRDHYDIPEERYDGVVAAGALPVTSRELITRLNGAGLRRRKAQALRPRRPGRPLVRARRLSVGDRVVVVAPAGPVPAARLDAGVAVLGSWGLRVEVAEHVLAHPQYVADGAVDDDAARAADLVRAWCDPGVAGVFCAGSGPGTRRVVDLVDWEALAEAGPRVLVGPEVTGLHQAFGSRLGLSTIHGPDVPSLASGAEGPRSHLRRLLLDPAPGLSLAPEPLRTLVGGQAEGVLVAGDLPVLAAGAGAPGALPVAGSVAVLGGVGEDVDPLLARLLRSGWFAGVLGIVLGDLARAPDAARGVLERLRAFGVPVVAGARLGHRAGHLALPLGVTARLDADAGTLVLRDPPLL